MEWWKRSASVPDVCSKKHCLSSEDEGDSVQSSSTCTSSSQGPVDGKFIHLQTFYVYTFLVGRASDHKYRYLSALECWVGGVTFYPIPNTTNVKVTVELEAGDVLVRESLCKVCCRRRRRQGY